MASSSPLTIYTYSNCSTCREAVKWLRSQGMAFEEKAIRETPPTIPELRSMLDFQDGNIRRLFNTSGMEYRAQKLSDKLPALGVDSALALLAHDGRLVKRPFVLGDRFGLLGFDARKWAVTMGRVLE